jgi:hypothetical protein
MLKKMTRESGATWFCLLDANRASTDQAKRMAGEQGFEPWYAGIKIQCLNQLGDSPTQPTACRYI